MKLPISGRTRPLTTKRTNLEDAPGSLLGEKRACCARCGGEFRASELSAYPPGRREGQPRILVCGDCK